MADMPAVSEVAMNCFLSLRILVLYLLISIAGCGPRQQPEAQSRPPTPAEPPSAPVESAAQPPVLGPPLEPPKQGAFTTGSYRNLFVELGKPKAEVDAKIAGAYQQLFHGEPKEQAVMFEAGSNSQGPLAYIMDIAHGDVRSEGMSYGMMIAVQLDHKQDFDALWNWAKTYMYRANEDHPAHGFFSWQMRPDGTPIDEMPAPDGEEYFAMALLFAANRWGSGKGIYDYKREAFVLLDDMVHRQPITGTVNRTRTTTGVALFNSEHKMVRFTPDMDNFKKNSVHTDPSYHLPAFYELWALWGPEQDRAFWREAAQVSRDYFVKVTHPTTGLAPDYAHFDGKPKAASWDKDTVHFRFDAWRTAMNWAMDAVWWAKDPRQAELSDRLLEFFAAQGSSYPNRFTLEGQPIGKDSSLGLISTNAVAALAATHPRAWRFVETLYQQSPPTGQWRYYDGLLYLMSLLHVSGRFRIITPEEASEPSSGQ